MKIFISHSSKDKEFVWKLAADLRLNQIDVWYDDWELNWGDSIVEKIQKGIYESSFQIIVLSPNSIESKWVKEELNAAIMIQLKNQSTFVLPILYKDCEIPSFLKDKKYVDFRKDYRKGLNIVLESIKKIKDQYGYLTDLLNRSIDRLPEPIPKNILIDFIDNCEKIDPEKKSFQILFEQGCISDLFLLRLYNFGKKHFSEEELVKKNIALRPVPYPEFRGFCIDICLSDNIGWTDICYESGYSPEDKQVNNELLSKTVDILSNLHSIGNQKAFEMILCFIGDCGRYNKEVNKIALSTREIRAIEGVFKLGTMGGNPGYIAEQSLESIGEYINILPKIKEFVYERFRVGHSYLQYSILKKIILFPHDVRLELSKIGTKSGNLEVKELAENYLRRFDKK